MRISADVGPLVFHPAEVARLVKTPEGAFGRDLLRRALLVEAEAKRLCPVDTDRLRSSIAHEMGLDALGLYVDVGTDVEYAIFVELGTSRMSAQPFLRPALDAARQ